VIDLGTLSEKYIDLEPFPPDRMLYRATHQNLSRRVVIRAMPRLSEDGSREHESLFQRGGRAVAGLSHPNIIQVLDYESTPAARLLVLEYLEGETLDTLLRREGPLPAERALRVAAQLADALALAHRRGVIHRNLRPAEILLTPGGQVKLGGFEAAALPADADDRWGRDPLLGNALYLAPEQMLGRPPTARSDLYSLGVLLYQMLAGRPPVSGSRAWSVLYRKAVADPGILSAARPGLSTAVEGLVMRLLRREPEARFESMEALGQALAELIGPTPAVPASATAYPFPIAHADRMIWDAVDYGPRLQRLLYAFEAAIKFCASVALLGRNSPDKPLTPDQAKPLSRPSLGHWVSFLRLATLEEPGPAWPVLGRLAEFAQGKAGRARGLDLLDRAVQARNRVAHGAGLDERDSRELFEELLPAWRTLVGGLSFLTEYPLGKVLRLRYESGRFAVTYRSYMGDNPSFRTELVEVVAPMEEGRFGLLGPAGLLDLTPLVQALECDRCGDEEVFFYNGMRGAKHDMLSYQKGHGFAAAGAADSFHRRGLGW
jgi:serine/threonine-protein kinase